MKRLLLVVALAMPMATVAQSKESKPAREKKATGSVNWEGQVVKATGAGAPDMRASSPAQARLGAERVAQMDAFRNLLAQIKGIQVSSGKTVADAMAKDEIRGKVEGVIRGYKVTGKRYYSDNGVEIDVEVPLAAITEVVAPESADEEKATLKAEGEPVNTGLVVDARGLAVSPALSPRLLDEEGKSLYGLDWLNEEARKENAVAAYVKGLDDAKKMNRVGAKPLVVKATKAEGSDLVLSPSDAKKLGATNNTFLAEGRVVIVTN